MGIGCSGLYSYAPMNQSQTGGFKAFGPAFYKAMIIAAGLRLFCPGNPKLQILFKIISFLANKSLSYSIFRTFAIGILCLVSLIGTKQIDM